MTDFSSVNLRILSPDGKTVLAELQTLDRVNQQTARRISDTQSFAMGQIQTKTAVAARNMAGNIAQIATVGAASAESMKGILTQGANMAFMFGTGGAVAGAVAVSAMAIVNLFTRTRREIEETARKAMEELGRLAEAGNIGAIGGRFGVATKLFSGDRFAARRKDESETDFMLRQRGIQGGRAEIARLEAIVAANQGGGALAQSARQNARNRMHELERALDKVIPRYEKLIALQREMEEQAGFAAGRSVAGRKVSFSAADDERLLRLQEKLGAGIAPDLLGLRGGKGERFGPDFNPAQASFEMLEGIKAAITTIPPLPPGELTPELERILAMDGVAASIGENFGLMLGNSIANGIAAGFQAGSLVEGIRAMTGAILSGLGQMAIQLGTAALAILIKQKLIKDAILSWAPGIGIAAALGLIVLGGALMAAGSGLSGGGRAGGGGGGGYAGGTGSTTYLGVVNPSGAPADMAALKPAQPINVNATFIGTRDPSAQRQLLEMIKFARERGEV